MSDKMSKEDMVKEAVEEAKAKAMSQLKALYEKALKDVG